MGTIRTLAEPFRFQPPPVKGSRFIATVAPASTAEAAMAQVDAVRGAMPDARHHCWAWRLGDGTHRSADDGEPGGSAGRPILAMIDGHDLVDVVVVVTRYFGGVKLGVGGLIRAYGGAAGQALDRAAIVEREVTVPLTLVHAYDDTQAVAAVLAAEGLTPRDTVWEAAVRVALDVPEDRREAVVRALTDRTAGRARFDEG